MLSFVFDTWVCFCTVFSSYWYMIFVFPLLICLVTIIKEVISHV